MREAQLRSSLASLSDRLERTSARPLLDVPDLEARTLLTRSGALHVAFVWLCSFVAFVGSEPVLGSALLPGGAPLFVGLSALGLSALFARRGALALMGLALLALGVGGLVAVLDGGSLAGLAPAYALATALAEALALALWLAKRGSLGPPLSLALAALTTAVLAYLLDGGLAPATSFGVAAGGALAVVFVSHARYAEGALALRHDVHQVPHAALSRWTEAARALFSWLIEIFLGPPDQRRDAST